MKDKSTYRPRVLVLTSTFPRWENDSEPAFVFELSRRLNMSFDVTILAPRSSGSKDKEMIAGLRVIRFAYFIRRWENLATHSGGILNRLRSNPFNYLLVPFFLLGQIWALVRLLGREKFDLIHAHWLIPQGMIVAMGLFLAKQKIPLICTSHGGDLFALRGTIIQHLKRWVVERSQALTVVSRAMRDTIIEMGINANKIEVISMGVDLKHLFAPNPKILRTDNELLFVGRLVEKKGVRTLLDALPQVINHHPHARLTVAGSGPLEKELKDLTERLKLTDKVDFLGMISQEQLPELYSRAALAIFPFIIAKSGDQEGFGLVQVEAMGCECPVIAGDLPPIHDIIAHEESGLLFTSGNLQALVNTILKALNDPDLCLRMAQEGRKKVVEQFDWDIVTDKYAEVYYKLSNIRTESNYTAHSKRT